MPFIQKFPNAFCQLQNQFSSGLYQSLQAHKKIQYTTEESVVKKKKKVSLKPSLLQLYDDLRHLKLSFIRRGA